MKIMHADHKYHRLVPRKLIHRQEPLQMCFGPCNNRLRDSPRRIPLLNMFVLHSWSDHAILQRLFLVGLLDCTIGSSGGGLPDGAEGLIYVAIELRDNLERAV
jgi:hypothetical protein